MQQFNLGQEVFVAHNEPNVPIGMRGTIVLISPYGRGVMFGVVLPGFKDGLDLLGEAPQKDGMWLLPEEVQLEPPDPFEKALSEYISRELPR